MTATKTTILALVLIAGAQAWWDTEPTTRTVTGRMAPMSTSTRTTTGTTPSSTTQESTRSAMSMSTGMSSTMGSTMGSTTGSTMASSMGSTNNDDEDYEDTVVVLAGEPGDLTDGGRPPANDMPGADGELTLMSCLNVPADADGTASLVSNCDIDWFVDFTNEEFGFSYDGTSVTSGAQAGAFVDEDDFAHHVAVVADWSSDSCECRPSEMTFRLVNNDCSTNNDQNDKFTCKELSASGTDVYVSSSARTTTPSASTVVAVGDTITIQNDGKLDANTKFYISGAIAQEINIHTSCSQSLRRGDVFGALEVVSWECTDGSQSEATDGPGTVTVQFYVDGIQFGLPLSVSGVEPLDTCDTTTVCDGTQTGTCGPMKAANYAFTTSEVSAAAASVNCNDPSSPPPGPPAPGTECVHVSSPLDLTATTAASPAENPICPSDNGELTLMACVNANNAPNPFGGLIRNTYAMMGGPSPPGGRDCVHWQLNEGPDSNSQSVLYNDHTADSQTSSSDSIDGAFPTGEATHVAVVIRPIQGSCDCHPTELTFRVTGGDCAGSSHDQGDRFDCDDSTASGGSAFVIDGESYNLGDLFVSSGDPRLGAQTDYAITGSVNQDLSVHTSCSRPLTPGDVYGALTLVGYQCNDGASGGMSAMSMSADADPQPERVSVSYYQNGVLISEEILSSEPIETCRNGDTTVGGDFDGTIYSASSVGMALSMDDIRNRIDSSANCNNDPLPPPPAVPGAGCVHVSSDVDLSGTTDPVAADNPICPAVDGELTLMACVTANSVAPGSSPSIITNTYPLGGPAPPAGEECVVWELYQSATENGQSLSYNDQTPNSESAVSDPQDGSFPTGVPTHIAVTITPIGGDCDCHPSQLSFVITGGDCVDSTNPQEDKYECEEKVHTGTGYTIDGVEYALGDVVTIGDSDRLSAQTDIYIYGPQAQFLSIHTSCSKRLSVGDVFGALTLVGIDCGEDGDMDSMSGMSSTTSDPGAPSTGSGWVRVNYYQNGAPVGSPVYLSSEWIEPCVDGDTAVGAGFDGTVHSAQSFSSALDIDEIRSEVDRIGECVNVPIPGIGDDDDDTMSMSMTTSSRTTTGTTGSMGTTTTIGDDDDDDTDVCNFPPPAPEPETPLITDCLDQEYTAPMPQAGPEMTIMTCYDGPSGDQGNAFANNDPVTNEPCMGWRYDGVNDRMVFYYGDEIIATPSGLLPGNFLDDDEGTPHHVTVSVGFTPPQPPCDCHPYYIQLRVVDGDCDTYTHDQSEKFKCTPGAASDGSGLVTVTSDTGDIVETGPFAVGDTFTINGGSDDKIKADSQLSFSGDVNLDMVFHGSCSKLLQIGDQFGPVVVVGYGGGRCDEGSTGTTTTRVGTRSTTAGTATTGSSMSMSSSGNDYVAPTECLGTVNARFYIDGVLIYEVDVPNSPPVLTCGGGPAVINQGLGGELKNLTVYTSQLTNDQVEQIANGMDCGCSSPTQTPSPTPSTSQTPSPTGTQTPSQTQSQTPSQSPSQSQTPTPAAPLPVARYCLKTVNDQPTTGPNNAPVLTVTVDTVISTPPTASCGGLDFSPFFAVDGTGLVWTATTAYPGAVTWPTGVPVTCDVDLVDDSARPFSAIVDPADTCEVIPDPSVQPTCDLGLIAPTTVCVGIGEQFDLQVDAGEEGVVQSVECNGETIDLTGQDTSMPFTFSVNNSLAPLSNFSCSVTVLDLTNNMGTTVCTQLTCPAIGRLLADVSGATQGGTGGSSVMGSGRLAFQLFVCQTLPAGVQPNRDNCRTTREAPLKFFIPSVFLEFLRPTGLESQNLDPAVPGGNQIELIILTRVGRPPMCTVYAKNIAYVPDVANPGQFISGVCDGTDLVNGCGNPGIVPISCPMMSITVDEEAELLPRVRAEITQLDASLITVQNLESELYPLCPQQVVIEYVANYAHYSDEGQTQTNEKPALLPRPLNPDGKAPLLCIDTLNHPQLAGQVLSFEKSNIICLTEESVLSLDPANDLANGSAGNPFTTPPGVTMAENDIFVLGAAGDEKEGDSCPFAFPSPECSSPTTAQCTLL